MPLPLAMGCGVGIGTLAVLVLAMGWDKRVAGYEGARGPVIFFAF